MRHEILIKACALLVLTGMVGCGTTKNTSPSHPVGRPTAQPSGRTVLIMPFADAPDAPGSGPMLTHAFYGAFVEETGGRYRVIDLTRIEQALNSRGKTLRSAVPVSVQNELAREMSADAVITGQVLVWKKGNFAAQPMVGFTARCRSVTDSVVLWSVSHTGSSFFVAAEERVPEMAAPRVCKKAIAKLIKRGQI